MCSVGRVGKGLQEVGGAYLVDALQEMRLEREPRDRFRIATMRRPANPAHAQDGGVARPVSYRALLARRQ